MEDRSQEGGAPPTSVRTRPRSAPDIGLAVNGCECCDDDLRHLRGLKPSQGGRPLRHIFRSFDCNLAAVFTICYSPIFLHIDQLPALSNRRRRIPLWETLMAGGADGDQRQRS